MKQLSPKSRREANKVKLSNFPSARRFLSFFARGQLLRHVLFNRFQGSPCPFSIFQNSSTNIHKLATCNYQRLIFKHPLSIFKIIQHQFFTIFLHHLASQGLEAFLIFHPSMVEAKPVLRVLRRAMRREGSSCRRVLR